MRDMRRPDIEMHDDVARFVEQHPDLIALLAGQAATGREIDSPGLIARRARFRGYVRDKVAFAGTEEANDAGRQFLARYTSAS